MSDADLAVLGTFAERGTDGLYTVGLDADGGFDGYGYSTELSRLGLSGHLNYSARNHIRKLVSHPQNASRPLPYVLGGSSAPAREWLQQFKRYRNRFRPHQAFDDQPPAKHI